MSRLSRSFSARLTTTILLITSILFLSGIMVVSYFSHKLIAEEAVKNASNVLNNTRLDIDKTLGNVEVSVSNMRWVVAEHLDDTAYLYHVVRQVVSSNDEIVGSAIAFRADFYKDRYYFSPYAYSDAGDSIRSKQLGNDQYDYFNMEWFSIPMNTKQPHWSNPYYDEGGGQMMMATYSYPLLDEQGEVYAVITADISLEWLSKKICSLQPYANSFTFLLCKNGSYISGKNPMAVMQYDSTDEEAANHNSSLDVLGSRMVAGDSGTLNVRAGHQISFAVYGPLNNGWSAAIISPYRDVFVHLMRMNLIITVVLTIGLFLLFVLCFRIVRKLTMPITEFSVAALNMAKGNFQAKLPEIKTQDEMLQLHDSFEYMQQSLTHYIEELRNTTSENERMESELNIARKIQMTMVPTDFPTCEEVSVHAYLRPAKEVGGDFYDFLIKDDDLFFAIGDVSGKGVPAALVMSITRSAFRFLGGVGLTIDQMIYKINDTLSKRNENNMFVTLFAGKINLKTGEMYYCNGGHNPLVLCHPDGRTEYLRVKPNIAVGVFDGFVYQPEKLQLEKGSRLILYTDGVTEAEDSQKNQYGEDRLLEYAQRISKDQTSKDVVEGLIKEVRCFTGDIDQNDDITVLTVHLHE